MANLCSLKMSGFQAPLSGWFWAPPDSQARLFHAAPGFGVGVVGSQDRVPARSSARGRAIPTGYKGLV